MNTEKQNPNEVRISRPYSCIGCPPVPRSGSEEKKPANVAVAMKVHEKYVSVAVADMRGQL